MATRDQSEWVLTTLAADVKEMKGDIKQLKDERILSMDKEITRLTVKTGRLEWFVYMAIAGLLGETLLMLFRWPN